MRLSEKKIEQNYEFFYREEDVKEFIVELKDKFRNDYEDDYFEETINDIAGFRLIK